MVKKANAAIILNADGCFCKRLVNQYWEDDPDYENIHACLNSGCHYSEEYIEFSHLNTFIFQDATECEYEGDEA